MRAKHACTVDIPERVRESERERESARERKRERESARAGARLYLLAMCSIYVIHCPCSAAQATLIAPAFPFITKTLPM